MLTQLVGPANTVPTDTRALGREFGMASWPGKRLALISDARMGGRDLSAAIEHLLQVSGNDSVRIARKFRDDWLGLLKARILLATNEVPILPDAAGAVGTRFIFLRLDTSFTGEDAKRIDPDLDQKLARELPAILGWAIRGWRYLQADGGFRQPAEGSQDLEALGTYASPIREFLDECVDVGKGLSVPSADLYRVYQAWADEQGIRQPESKTYFSRNLRSVVGSGVYANVEISARFSYEGRQVRGVQGLALSEHGAKLLRQSQTDRLMRRAM